MFNMINMEVKQIRLIIKERKDAMEKLFMRAEEVAQELEVSKSYAYKLIQQLNAELEDKGFITISGRVNRQYFRERLYGTSQKEVK